MTMQRTLGYFWRKSSVQFLTSPFYSAKNALKKSNVLRPQFSAVPHLQYSSSNIEIPHHHYEHEEVLTHSYCQGATSKPLIGETIGQRLDKVTELYPDREFLVCADDNKRATYADFREEVDKLAAGFLAMGIKRGDRVGMWGPNCLEWVLMQYAMARAGIIMVNINPAYRSSELEYALNKVGCKALVMLPRLKTSNFYDILKEVAPDLEVSSPEELQLERFPDLKHVILSEGEAMKGTMTLESVLNFGGIGERQQIHDLQNVLQFDDPVNIQFTSGTTGNPKGATLTHHQLLNNAYFTGINLDYNQPNTKICIPVPLYHCFAMVLGSLASMCFGATAVYPCRGFDPHLTLKAIHKERCTSVYGTPTMFIDMLSSPEMKNVDFSSMRTGVMAGSPCPIEVMKQIIDRMNCREMTIAYGLTETSPVTNATTRDDPIDLRVSTVGRPFPCVEVKVVNESDQIVPVNTPGELCFRGYLVMQGYWNDPKKTREAIDDKGWFHSGDLAVMDENKYCKIIGRIKDMIIRGGENIYPTEIEQFLYKHPKVQDIQVIGVPDERMGEEVCAWIKLRQNETATAEEIKDFCRGKISHFKIPKFIKFVDGFPLTITGKIKKFEMRNQMCEELSGK
ncbi:medium-chain acyl-CoA ligase ACSF2, mitochondrial-like [Rhopilema esculentum]|uniref:medium-chain acyl-CoA ligase ACSF2, mitochondrial-like n=1 Tax=Rhopilema esculentum TaxID=499914 RepID=UPI0031D34F20